MSRILSPRRSRGVLVSGAAAVALVLLIGSVGCSSDDGDAASGPTTTAKPKPWPDQPMPALTVPLEIEDTLTVIDRYVSGSAIADTLARRDRLALECLSDRGFDVELEAADDAAPPGPATLDITRGEFAETWGFGQVTTLQADGGVRPEYLALSSRRDQRSLVPAGLLPPPELDYDAVPEADRAAVSAALFGAPETTDDGAVSVDGGTPTPTGAPVTSGPGCATVANDEAGLEEGAGPIAAAADLRSQASERVANDAEILALKEQYAACMAELGFDGMATPTEAGKAIGVAYDALVQEAVAAANGAQPNADSVGPEIVQRFTELGAREIAVAAANLGCEAEYMSAAQPVSDRVQQRVIDDNPALVAQLGES